MAAIVVHVANNFRLTPALVNCMFSSSAASSEEGISESEGNDDLLYVPESVGNEVSGKNNRNSSSKPVLVKTVGVVSSAGVNGTDAVFAVCVGDAEGVVLLGGRLGFSEGAMDGTAVGNSDELPDGNSLFVSVSEGGSVVAFRSDGVAPGASVRPFLSRISVASALPTEDGASLAFNKLSGNVVGSFEGYSVAVLEGLPLPEGSELGSNDGIAEGSFEGLSVGLALGLPEGSELGPLVGVSVGVFEGFTVGTLVGISEATAVGSADVDGSCEAVGLFVG